MICYSDLKIDTNCERPYCHGQQACVNMSGIFSTLMKEAGKCESYASDLLIDLYPILKWQRGDANFDTITNETFLFGFRDCGVDHDKFIKARLEQGYEYRSIYSLRFEREDFDDLDWINVWFKKVV